MVTYILRRLGYGLLIILGVVIVVFFLFHALPGDPVALMAGQRSDLATRQEITEDLGLDKPVMVQFVLYLNDLSPFSLHKDTLENKKKYKYKELVKVGGAEVWVVKWPYFRRSFQTNKPVSEILVENFEPTFWLAIVAMFFATFVGVTLGVFAAIKQNTWVDHLLISTSVIGISVPTFLSAILMAMVFGYYLGDYTGLNLTGQLWEMHPLRGKEMHLENIILPSITLGMRPLAIIVQLTRSSMLEVLSQDYIRTAWAKGLKFFDIVFRHALKNALNPVITAVSGWLASLMAGAFFVEYIFDWKGIGFVTIKAVESLDFPVVMGSTLFIAVVFVVVNIVVDILYAVIDPRVRLS